MTAQSGASGSDGVSPADMSCRISSSAAEDREKDAGSGQVFMSPVDRFCRLSVYS